MFGGESLKIGVYVQLGNVSDPRMPGLVGRALEERGFESIWVGEHVVLFEDYDSPYPYTEDYRVPITHDSGIFEPFTILSYIAATTRTLRLGTGMCLVPQRNPVYTAKHVADLDVLSGGRLEFGVALGWQREEYESVGVPWPKRGARAEEYVQIMKSLWRDDVSSYDGDFYNLRPSSLYPKPYQRPHPPIHFGGESDATLRRVARVGQGWFGFNRNPVEAGEGLRKLDQALEEHGRSRADVEITICPFLKGIDAASMEEYARLGIQRLVLVVPALQMDDLHRQLDGLVTQVVEVAAKLP